MWIVAGVLLGSVLLTALLGFHSGPHLHAAAGAVGLVAAGWLLFMAADGRAAPLLWTLLGVDLVASAGVGVLGWVGLAAGPTTATRPPSLAGAEGVAVTDLSPEGIVRVRGEQWSASSVNGPATAGTRIQVLRADGVRLEVWAEQPEIPPGTGADGPRAGEEQTR